MRNLFVLAAASVMLASPLAAQAIHEGRSVASDPSRSLNPAVRFNGWGTTARPASNGNPGFGEIGVPLRPSDLGYDPRVDGR
jgi:hypothetical protein